MKLELNEHYLKKLEPPEAGRLEISDTKRTGLRLRVYSSGRAVWMYEKRVKGGAKRKHTLGVYCTWNAVGKRETGPIGLAEARRVALDIEAEAARGFDRVLNAENARREEQKAAASIQTVQNVLETYSELHLSNLKSGDERKRQLTDALTKHLDQPIGILTRASLQKSIDDKAKEGKLFMANRIRAALKHFTHWAWRREYIDADVGDRLERATKERIRERVLSLTEVREIWAKSFELGDLWGPLLRLLVLTVQRRSSVTGLRKSELDLTNNRFKKATSDEKNDRAHITHLSPQALTEIEHALKRLEKMEDAEEDFLFSTTGRTPLSGWSKAKSRLDKHLGKEFEHWRFHDIRTAFATHMAERGVSESVVDRVLNHAATASKASAVARVYNQAELLTERAVALDNWAELVTSGSAMTIQSEAEMSSPCDGDQSLSSLRNDLSPQSALQKVQRADGLTHDAGMRVLYHMLFGNDPREAGRAATIVYQDYNTACEPGFIAKEVDKRFLNHLNIGRTCGCVALQVLRNSQLRGEPKLSQSIFVVSEWASTLRTNEDKAVPSDARNLRRYFNGEFKPVLHLWAALELIGFEKLDVVFGTDPGVEQILKAAAWFELNLLKYNAIENWQPLCVPERFKEPIRAGNFTINLPPEEPEIQKLMDSYKHGSGRA